MQNKFIKQDTKLLSSVKKSIKEEINRGISRFDHEVFNTKHLTECPRRIMYRANAEENYQFNSDSERRKRYDKKRWVDFFDQSSTISLLSFQTPLYATT